mmetsp:Transcript_56439/g.121103  ORF Transcript_56439/g.121103 Transcript_56439/m.121103 type:complete len:1219 (-) Transcript_56439:381-4037(-)
MLVKLETKSNRVKGISFHARLSFVLSSLHNGSIQFWDYRTGSVIDKFEEHDGPVRGVCFHVSQPLFVSGGDDYKIKVWNYKLRRCMFNLLGHLDYIRTVQFHHDYPWILSSSDDQTVRIWNWQSRSCIAVMTGHNHYVMCAHFHPKEDLVVSASLDQTVRVWDTSGLREKTVAGASTPGARGGAPDVFGTTDAVVKHVLEGHDRGVNWAAFHPKQNLIASCADDRLIKIWRWDDSKAWEVDTLRGHFGNVSCVIFHPQRDLILSNSEDRTIRVWDLTKRTGIHTYRRENDRFWVITAHQASNLLAVGHDSGMVVFKLDRERPIAQSNASTLFYVQDRQVFSRDMDKAAGSERMLFACRRAANQMTSGMRYLCMNPFNSSTSEANCLIYYDQDGGAYDLLMTADVSRPDKSQTHQGQCQGICFTARNRFAVLSKDGSISIMNLNNENTKKFEAPNGMTPDNIFPGGNNRLVIKGEDKLVLYDLTSRKVINELTMSGGARYCVWSPNFGHVALLSKHAIVLADKNFALLHSVHETARVKSGAWDENGVFICATATHVKYVLPNGDSGIVHSLVRPIYIQRIARHHMYYVDRDNQVHKDRLNSAEYLFKLALHKRQFNDVKTWIKNGRLCGNVVIGYLKKQGFPEIALHFVEEQQTRFNLALEYGHIEEAMTAAQALDDKDCWTRLGVEALRQGNQQIVEMVYQKTRNFDALSFLYLITGNTTKLKKMLAIAEKRGDVMSRFNNAMMLGDIEERVKVLSEVGQVPLAALTAQTHGLTEMQELLAEGVQGVDIGNAIPADAELLLPAIPVYRADAEHTNWPLLMSTQAIFENNLAQAAAEAAHAAAQAEEPPMEDAMEALDVDDDPGAGWGDDDAGAGVADPSAWGDDLDLDLGDVPDVAPVPAQTATLSRGESAAARWLKKRKLVGDLVAAGEFDEALNTLQRRIGLANAAPLQPLFREAYMGVNSFLAGLPQAPAVQFPILASGSLSSSTLTPFTFHNATSLMEGLKEGNKLTTAGKFQEALTSFRKVVQSLPLAVANSQEEDQQLTEFIDICREYITAMRCQIAQRASATSDAKRSIELAAYMTLCKLQPTHTVLTLRGAMSAAFKAQNFITAASFARRIVSGNAAAARQPELVAQARKLLAVCEQKGSDAMHLEFDHRETDNFTICASSLTPIAAAAPTARCPFCQSVYKAEFKGQVCSTCELSEIGANTLGIQFRPI